MWLPTPAFLPGHDWSDFAAAVTGRGWSSRGTVPVSLLTAGRRPGLCTRPAATILNWVLLAARLLKVWAEVSAQQFHAGNSGLKCQGQAFCTLPPMSKWNRTKPKRGKKVSLDFITFSIFISREIFVIQFLLHSVFQTNHGLFSSWTFLLV